MTPVHLRLAAGGHDVVQFRQVQRGAFGSTRRHAPGNAEDPVARHQRFDRAAKQRIHVGHPQPAQFQHVLEARVGDQRQPGTLLLDDRVDPHGGAVDEALDLCGDNPMVGLQQLQPDAQLGPGIVRGGQDLDGVQGLRVAVVGAEIDEGAADVDADMPAHDDLSYFSESSFAGGKSPVQDTSRGAR